MEAIAALQHPPAAAAGPGYLQGDRRHARGGKSGGGRCPRVSWETHFVLGLCEKVTALEEYPQGPAAGRLEGELFLFKQEVAAKEEHVRQKYVCCLLVQKVQAFALGVCLFYVNFYTLIRHVAISSC